MFGKIQLIVIGSVLLFGALTGIYYSWRSSIERQALLEYNQLQLEQNIKDQQAMKDKLQAMDQKQREVDEANAAEKKVFKSKMDEINSSIEAKGVVDKSSSEVLKKTVSKLKDVVK